VTLWLARLVQAATILLPFAGGVAGAAWMHATLTCTGPAIIPCGYVRVASASLTLAFGALATLALLATSDLARAVTSS
jgi:hypothetical protein